LGEEGLERLRQQACASGVELELGTRGLELDHLKSQVSLCERLGATLLRTVPEIDGRTPLVSEIRACLNAIVPLLEEKGVCLAMENGNIPAGELARTVDEAGSSSVGVVLDTANSLAIHEGWRYVTDVLAPYTMCLHVKDVSIMRVWHMMGFVCEGRPAGQGQLDIPWIIEACKHSRHDFNVILELWPPEQDTLEDTIRIEQAWAEESIAFLRKYVPE